MGDVEAVTEIALVDEPGRALRGADVRAATGCEVRGRLPCDPAVARAVDAGLLATRLPRSARAVGTAA